MRRLDRRSTVAVIALLVTLSGCTTVRWVSDYDEHIDNAATALQRDMDGHLTHLEALGDDEDATFAANEDFYREYGIALRSVRVRAQGHEDNEITLQQLDRMNSSLEELRDQHRESGVLSPAYIRTVRDLFNSGWGAVIAWEIAKKRGES